MDTPLMEALAAAGFYMAGVDGAYVPEEIHRLLEKLRTRIEDPGECETVLQRVHQAMNEKGRDAYLTSLVGTLNGEQRSEVLEFAKEVAWMDNELHERELAFYLELAALLGVSRADAEARIGR